MRENDKKVARRKEGTKEKRRNKRKAMHVTSTTLGCIK
jgi:hypothetical protein